MLRQMNVAKSDLLLKTSNFLQFQRKFQPESPKEYKPESEETQALQAAWKNLTLNPIPIPIAIGDVDHHSGDIHMQRMPHNIRCSVARMSWANRRIVDKAIMKAKEMLPQWRAVPVEKRLDIWRKCADSLANEDRHLLNASIMLGQGKTLRQAEEDTCRTINDMRFFIDVISKQQGSEDDCCATCEHLLRSTGGFVAALTPFNWTSCAANLALCPALMGNCVLWMPSPFSALSCYLIYKALDRAEIPPGVITFIPSNPNLFVDHISRSKRLAGINFAGRLYAYQEVGNSVSEHMKRQASFRSALGPGDGKNFHFMHESADTQQVVDDTVLAAFDYSGQRGSSCEVLFVPDSKWCEVQDALVAKMEELNVGDVCKLETDVSAVINQASFERIVALIQHAEESDTCEIIHGGKYMATHGYYIVPTLIECNTMKTKIMKTQIDGPVLSVFVYEQNKMEELLEQLAKEQKYTIAGAVYAEDNEIAVQIGDKLAKIAANLYLNKPCIGATDGQSLEEPPALQNIQTPAECQLSHWVPPCT